MAVLRSFMEVFPSVQIWQVGYDAVMVAGPDDLPLPVGQIAERATGKVRDDLERTGIHGPIDLISYWIGGEELRRAVPPGPINTDDNMKIEFAAPLRMLSRDPARLDEQKRGRVDVRREIHRRPVVPALPGDQPGEEGRVHGAPRHGDDGAPPAGRGGRGTRAPRWRSPSRPGSRGARPALRRWAGLTGHARRGRRGHPSRRHRRAPDAGAALDAGDGGAVRRFGAAVLALDPGDRAAACSGRQYQKRRRQSRRSPPPGALAATSTPHRKAPRCSSGRCGSGGSRQGSGPAPAQSSVRHPDDVPTGVSAGRWATPGPGRRQHGFCGRCSPTRRARQSGLARGERPGSGRLDEARAALEEGALFTPTRTPSCSSWRGRGRVRARATGDRHPRGVVDGALRPSLGGRIPRHSWRPREPRSRHRAGGPLPGAHRTRLGPDGD